MGLVYRLKLAKYGLLIISNIPLRKYLWPTCTGKPTSLSRLRADQRLLQMVVLHRELKTTVFVSPTRNAHPESFAKIPQARAGSPDDKEPEEGVGMSS